MGNVSLSPAGRNRTAPCQGEGVHFLQTFPPPSPLSRVEVLWNLCNERSFFVVVVVVGGVGLFCLISPSFFLHLLLLLVHHHLVACPGQDADMDWGTDLWVSVTADSRYTAGWPGPARTVCPGSARLGSAWVKPRRGSRRRFPIKPPARGFRNSCCRIPYRKQRGEQRGEQRAGLLLQPPSVSLRGHRHPACPPIKL